VLYLYTLAGEFKTLEPHFSGSCVRVEGIVGAEDITIHPNGHLAYLSSDDRRAVMAGEPRPGAIYTYSLNTDEPVLSKLDSEPMPDFHPHGIGLLARKGEPDRLFVVNHPGASLFHDKEEKGPAHSIEIFDVSEGRLIRRDTITDPALISPNDVIPVGPDRFYVTNDHGSAGATGRMLEDYLRLARANVIYFDGEAFREVAEGLRYANGINLSQDGATLYVACPTDRSVVLFERDAQAGSLHKSGEVFLGSGPDNIELDPEGNLWVAAHPKLLTFVAHSKSSDDRSPSQVLKLVPDGEDGFSVHEIYLSEGEDLSASSVAARRGKRLLIGGVFDPLFLDCRME
jgi:arylesterase / paraoxonase